MKTSWMASIYGNIPVPWILWGWKTFMFDENPKIANFSFHKHLSPLKKLGRWFSFSIGWVFGSILIFQGVKNTNETKLRKTPAFFHILSHLYRVDKDHNSILRMDCWNCCEQFLQGNSCSTSNGEEDLSHEKKNGSLTFHEILVGLWRDPYNGL